MNKFNVQHNILKMFEIDFSIISNFSFAKQKRADRQCQSALFILRFVNLLLFRNTQPHLELPQSLHVRQPSWYIKLVELQFWQLCFFTSVPSGT
jgi:hypothetical protein